MLWDWLKSLIVRELSDKEINSKEWVLCNKCEVNILKQDLIDNDGVCPNCNNRIFQEDYKEDL